MGAKLQGSWIQSECVSFSQEEWIKPSPLPGCTESGKERRAGCPLGRWRSPGSPSGASPWWWCVSNLQVQRPLRSGVNAGGTSGRSLCGLYLLSPAWTLRACSLSSLFFSSCTVCCRGSKESLQWCSWHRRSWGRRPWSAAPLWLCWHLWLIKNRQISDAGQHGDTTRPLKTAPLV